MLAVQIAKQAAAAIHLISSPRQTLYTHSFGVEWKATLTQGLKARSILAQGNALGQSPPTKPRAEGPAYNSLAVPL
jgi:hypothetical protein